MLSGPVKKFYPTAKYFALWRFFLGLYKGQTIIHICFDDYKPVGDSKVMICQHIICCIYINIPFDILKKKKNSMEQVITSAVTEEEVETQKMVNCSRSQGPE